MSYIRKLDKPHVFPDGRYSYEAILAPEGLRATSIEREADMTIPRGLTKDQIEQLRDAVENYRETADNDRSVMQVSTVCAADDLWDAAGEVVDALLDENGLAPTDATLTVLDTSNVWVFDAEATGPEGGDYDGRQSVHATKDGALLALFDFIHGLGVDPRDPDATDAYVDEYKDLDGEIWQICGTVETVTGWNAHYGVRRTEVRT